MGGTLLRMAPTVGHVCDPERLHGQVKKMRIQFGRGQDPNVMISKPRSIRFHDKPGSGK